MSEAPRATRPASVLIIGSGPVVIGQAAEFDYAGTQACRALRAEGVRTVLVNSNPATIMTDPDVADAVYLEPLTIEAIEAVIAAERPEGLLAGLGGQTGLNLAMDLARAGVLARYNVKLLGTPLTAIEMAEDREAFRDLYHDRGATPLREAVADVRDRFQDKTGSLVLQLCSWIEDHLENAVKGRVQEAHRTSVVGGRPNGGTTREVSCIACSRDFQAQIRAESYLAACTHCGRQQQVEPSP